MVINGVTIEPLGNATKRDPFPESEGENNAILAKDQLRIKASEFSISKMLEHLNQMVQLPTAS